VADLPGYAPHVERLRAVASSPSTHRLAVAGDRDVRDPGAVSTSVTILSWPNLEAVASIGVKGSVTALAFCRDDVLAIGTASGALLVHHPDGHRLGIDESRHRGAIQAIAADPAGKLVATAGDDGVLSLSGLDGSGAPLAARTHALSPRSLRAVRVDPEGSVIAAAGDDGVVRTLSLGNGSATPREMPLAGDGVGALEFIGDGRIAAGCADGSIRICYLEGAADAEDRSRKNVHEDAVIGLHHGVALEDDAGRPLPRRLFSVSVDGSIKSWQIDSRRPPKTYKVGGQPSASALIPAPDGSSADRRGGTICVVDRGRRISLTRVNEQSEPSESIKRIASRMDQLAADLGADADKVRLAAITALESLVEDEARKLLDRALGGDKKPEVRIAAARAISRGDRRLSRPALRSALDDGKPEVRSAALATLTAIERPTPLAVAKAALKSKHVDMRVEALRRLPGLREASPLVPAMIAGALGDGRPEVRLAALDALYELEPDRPLEAARTGLGKGPADIRREVLVRIGRARLLGDPDGARLVESALDDGDAMVRSVAFLVGIAAIAPLAAAIKKADPHTAKGIEEIEAGSDFADHVSAPARVDDADLRPLFAAMACRNPDTALRAARALALLGDPRATGALLQLSREPDDQIRRHVVEALFSAVLAMPGDARPVDRLRWLLDDPSETVRQDAFGCLAQISDGPAAELDLAVLALRARRPDIRVRALPILVKYGPDAEDPDVAAQAERASEALGDALDDEHDKVRGEAFRTLWAWHSRDPQTVLTRAAMSRQAEVRTRVVTELGHQKPAENLWADGLLVSLVGDGVESVGRAAYKALTDFAGRSGQSPAKSNDKDPDEGKERVDVHLAAMASPVPAVRVLGLQGAPRTDDRTLVEVIVGLISDDNPSVHTAAIEALDRIDPSYRSPSGASGFALAFGSLFYGLRVRAMELCGRRRDTRVVGPAREFLSIPEGHINRPVDPLRQRAARALADCGERDTIPFLIGLLDDPDPLVREMGACGLATAARPGDERALLDATSHQDLPVRSWAAEGLARLGDDRALPVLAGTQGHEHLPIRQGAILGFVALGPDGVRGILAGLDDPVREIQDLVFAVIVARDIALQQAGEPPDLLLSALSSARPEIRFAAARLLESRGGHGDNAGEVIAFAHQLVGPTEPQKAADAVDWPEPAERERRLGALIRELASDHPAHRYAAAQVLTLRSQPLAFWREAETLIGPTSTARPRIPFTSWDTEARQPTRRGWIRPLLGGSDGAGEASASQLAFGTYAGLIRQAPLAGEADETHRVRRDATGRLGQLASSDSVGREAVLPVLRRALSDPHHLVRRAAVAALRGLYPEGALEPLALELQSSAADVGRGAVNELIEAAASSAAARAAALDTINAPVAEVRRHALSRLPQLFDSGSIEPWLVAIESRYSDTRLQVVYYLTDSSDERVLEALGRAMESDHEDLRMEAATALARRGDVRTVDALAGFLYNEDRWWAVIDAFDELISASDTPETRAACAAAIVSRLEDDPDQTADRGDLLSALHQYKSPAAGEYLLGLIAGDQTEDYERRQALDILFEIAADNAPRADRDRPAVKTELALEYATELVGHKLADVRRPAVERLLVYTDDRRAESMLAALLEDRDESVRIAAAEALRWRAVELEDASIDPLLGALRAGRRELVLPAAEGVAARRRPEAFNPLMLVFVAGEQHERARAVLALGDLGDPRALDDLEPIIDPRAELEDEDRALAPQVVEAMGRMLGSLEGDLRDKIRAKVEELAREGAPEIRRAAFAGLRAAGDARSREFLEAIAGDRLEVDDARLSAIAELGKLESPESESVLIDVVREGARNDNGSLGSSALSTLEAIFPNDKTRTSIIALESAVSWMSSSAADYLAWHGDSSTLLSRLGEVSDPAIRAQLRLGLIRRADAPPGPVTALLESDSDADRIDGLWIAGSAGAEPLAGAVARAASEAPGRFAAAEDTIGGDRDEAAEVWRVALWAADRLGADAGAAARAAIASAARPPIPAPVRLAAVRYLGARGAASDAGPLGDRLTDPDADVRAAAARAIADLAPDSAATALDQAGVTDVAAFRPLVDAVVSRSPDPLMGDARGRQLAVPAMIAGDRVDALTRIAHQPGDGADRIAAINALGRLFSEQAETALAELLSRDGEPDAVRAETFKALRRLQRRRERFADMPRPPEASA
jgi:ParB family chromosome partitioning protein